MKIRILFALVLAGVLAATAFGQKDPMSDLFEKQRSQFRTERFAEGEDASSGWNYIRYSRNKLTIKIRQSWSSSASREQETMDVYFHKNGDIAVVVVYPKSKKQYLSAPKGGRMTIAPAEVMTFKDGKMTGWYSGKTKMTESDSGWNQKSAEALENAKQLVATVDELRAEEK